MKVLIQFETSNAAWQDYGEAQLLAIMKHCYAKICPQLDRSAADIDEESEVVAVIRDINGNTIGEIKIARS